MKGIFSSTLLFLAIVFVSKTTSQQIQDHQHQDLSHSNQRCAQTPASSEKLERVINECQDEIKLAILQEALESLQEAAPLPHKGRERRDATFSNDERTIAGCLLQCVYRKVGAADSSGFPDPEGLVKFYVDGVEDRGYLGATKIAVHLCTRQALLQRSQKPKPESDESLIFGRQRRRLDTTLISATGFSQKIPPAAAAGGGAQACDEAFDVFQCVTERLATYCGSK